MNTTDYLHAEVRREAKSFSVYRDTTNRTYGTDGLTKIGAIPLWLFDGSATSSVVVEGTEEDTAFTGLLRPSADLTTDGDGPDGVSVADELRLRDSPQKRFEVRTKVAVPTAFDPDVYRLGVDRANDSA